MKLEEIESLIEPGKLLAVDYDTTAKLANIISDLLDRLKKAEDFIEAIVVLPEDGEMHAKSYKKIATELLAAIRGESE